MNYATALKRIFRSRLTLFIILLLVEGMFFVTNMANSVLRAPDDGWELKIAAIDNHLTPQGIWLIPYAIGFVFAALIPLWAAFNMPIRLYRQYILAMIVAATFSYVFYILVPTYVTKPVADDVPGRDLFAVLLRRAYDADNAYSTHNAAPSQHVFYALINMCFMIRFRPRARTFWLWTTLAALITASALLTRQHHSPDLIAGYLVAVGAYWAGLRLGDRVTAWLNDDNDHAVAPLTLGRLDRLRRRRRAWRARIDTM